jgi:DNA-binding transcriptional regulator YiaG
MLELNFPLLIKSTRKSLGETQGQFGKRFDVSDGAVSFWESGTSQAPYRVLSFVMLNYMLIIQQINELTRI